MQSRYKSTHYHCPAAGGSDDHRLLSPATLYKNPGSGITNTTPPKQYGQDSTRSLLRSPEARSDRNGNALVNNRETNSIILWTLPTSPAATEND